MNLLQASLRLLLFPGGIGALALGLLARGVAAFWGARARGRPTPAIWEPFADLWRLARKGVPEAMHPAVAWAALLAIAGLVWAASLLPWPEGHLDAEGNWIAYVALLAAPALARLMAAGFSGNLDAAWGARLQAPLEVSRLLPLLWGSATLPLATRQLELASQAAVRPLGAVALLLAAVLFLATLPWPLWDRDRRQAPLAGIGGRWLALYRALEALELAVQAGLVAVALRAIHLFPVRYSWIALASAWIACTAVLAAFEASGQEFPTELTVRCYTRWLAPLAFLATLLAAWAGR